jgi:hypothetical protein
LAPGPSDIKHFTALYKLGCLFLQAFSAQSNVFGQGQEPTKEWNTSPYRQILAWTENTCHGKNTLDYLTQPSTITMTLRLNGILSFWHFGILAFWHFGILAFWHFGILAFWQLV